VRSLCARRDRAIRFDVSNFDISNGTSPADSTQAGTPRSRRETASILRFPVPLLRQRHATLESSTLESSIDPIPGKAAPRIAATRSSDGRFHAAPLAAPTNEESIGLLILIFAVPLPLILIVA
jgi:hypothetical protein